MHARARRARPGPPRSGGQSACITNPNGPPGAAPPPNGGCYNLGGAYGDTVVNGGYRCTPVTGQSADLGIDKCVNGAWMQAFTCTCQVTSSISGTQSPSQCFDIDAPNTARREYAVDYCEQCDPIDLLKGIQDEVRGLREDTNARGPRAARSGR